MARKSERALTGVSGLDDVLGGGLTPERAYLSPGTGSAAGISSATGIGGAIASAAGSAASRLRELLPKPPKPRGRPPGRMREAVLLVNDMLQTGGGCPSQAAACADVATAFGLKPASLAREFRKMKKLMGRGKFG
jgi:hypothetical protein